MKKVIPLFALLFIFVSCSAYSNTRNYRDYTEWFDAHMPNGFITIYTNPSNAAVYDVTEDGETQIATTPVKLKIKASGIPYYFIIKKEGYYEYRLDLRPTPLNPDIELRISLHQRPDYPFNANRGMPKQVSPGPFATNPEVRNLPGGVAGAGPIPVKELKRTTAAPFVGETERKAEGETASRQTWNK